MDYVLAERVGQREVGGCDPLGDSVWQLLKLAVEKLYAAPGQCAIFLLFCTKQIWKTLLSPCKVSIYGTVGSFLSGRVFSGQRALTIMTGCGQGHELTKNIEKLWLKLPVPSPQNTDQRSFQPPKKTPRKYNSVVKLISGCKVLI